MIASGSLCVPALALWCSTLHAEKHPESPASVGDNLSSRPGTYHNILYIIIPCPIIALHAHVTLGSHVVTSPGPSKEDSSPWPGPVGVHGLTEVDLPV